MRDLVRRETRRETLNVDRFLLQLLLSLVVWFVGKESEVPRGELSPTARNVQYCTTAPTVLKLVLNWHLSFGS